MQLHLGVKSDPIEYRYTFPWLFRLMAEEGVTELQLGSFFEVYQLPDDYFRKLRRQAADHGIRIASLFTAHRELGGFFREDPEWVPVARRNYERFIEVGALLGAKAVGSNPGAVPRDLMGLKAEGLERFLEHFRELLVFARARGVDWLTIEPMSCLAEPPTLPEEVRAMGDRLVRYHAENPSTTARPGYCADIAHGYLDQAGRLGYDHLQLFEATLPHLYEVHLKNTDERFHSTFGFAPAERAKGIVDVAGLRDLLHARAVELPVTELTGYLEIGGPKLGRDYTDPLLGEQLRTSLRYLRETFLAAPRAAFSPIPAAPPAPSTSPAGVQVEGPAGVARRPAEAGSSAGAAPSVPLSTPAEDRDRVEIAPSMMCVDPLNFESALRRVEALGVDLLHLDVMDGRFVPNLPLGLGVVQALARKTRLPLDVHLMVEDNDLFLDLLAGCGARQISVHAETCRHLDRTLGRIRQAGARAGLALNPATPLAVLEYALERLDYVLLMTVNPGFAGQALTPAALRKIADCRRFLDQHGRNDLPIQVDGNVSFAHIPAMVAAGARQLVAGTSSLFHSGASWEDNLRRTRAAIAAGLAGLPGEPA